MNGYQNGRQQSRQPVDWDAYLHSEDSADDTSLNTQVIPDRQRSLGTNPVSQGRRSSYAQLGQVPGNQENPFDEPDQDPLDYENNVSGTVPQQRDDPYADAEDSLPATDEEVSYDPMDEAELLATNRTVCLTCTLSAMIGLFALFLLFAEKNSRAIRHYSIQSILLTVTHLIVIAVCLITGSILGAIPLLGFVSVLCSYLAYFGVFVYLIIMRIRLMKYAWNGLRYDVPGAGWWLRHFE